MKLNTLAFAAVLLLFSCTDNKAVEKKLMNDIMATHEKVMANDEKLMDNKIMMDSLLKADRFDPKDSAAKKTEMRQQVVKLSKADAAMDDWMHKFDPGTKTGDAKMNYLQEQNKLILQVDTMINNALRSSTLLLSKNKK